MFFPARENDPKWLMLDKMLDKMMTRATDSIKRSINEAKAMQKKKKKKRVCEIQRVHDVDRE
jgi:hypothetical protein